MSFACVPASKSSDARVLAKGHRDLIAMEGRGLSSNALVAEPGSGFEAASGFGLIARARERLRCFAEHRARLITLAFGFSEDRPSLPHRACPLATLPHARDAFRFGQERACAIQLTGSRTRRGRAR